MDSFRCTVHVSLLNMVIFLKQRKVWTLWRAAVCNVDVRMGDIFACMARVQVAFNSEENPTINYIIPVLPAYPSYSFWIYLVSDSR